MRSKPMSSTAVSSTVSQVILMDATVATGAAAMMAIRVLLDHDVPEENINLVSLLMAESGAATLKQCSLEHRCTGVHTIAYAFPGVKIVTSAVDPEINEKFHVMPGIGNFGDRFASSLHMFVLLSSVSTFRYFGTEPKVQHNFKSENSLSLKKVVK